ncbi:hypothetical protein [Arthrobacter sp. UYCo732]|uniref:hypothetical protein n=1 Tax=Arthrobacter sp. UYCo732 TaxID=3156336 RepID=UPI0033953931
MPAPSITLTPAPALIEEEFTMNAASTFLGTHKRNIEKLRAAGYLDDLTLASLTPIRTADFVSADKKLPLIQTAPAEVAVEETDWRNWYGDSPSLSNEDWINAQRGDWTGAGAERIEKVQYLAVGLGGIITGATRVIKAVPSSDPRKARFELQLLGRLTGDLKSGDVTFNEEASEDDLTFAHSVVGKRYEPRAGGSVMWL